MSSPKSSDQYVLIMAGGAGTRLWPLSRQEHPKQFHTFVGEQSLLQHMVELACQVVPLKNIFIMAVPAFSASIKEQIPDLPDENLLFEPARRDTGPAVVLGMLQIQERHPEAKVAVLWSDHHIENPTGFKDMLVCGYATLETQKDALIVIGVNPTFPNTGFGYIQMGSEVEHCGEELRVFTVRRFVEKPDLETATKYVSSWDYLWNVGYEITRTDSFLAKLASVRADLEGPLAALKEAVAAGDHKAITAAYGDLPKQSVELLFTQQHDRLLVIPADLGWSDLGSWNILHDVLKERHPDKMVIRGDVMLVDSKDSLVFAKDRPIALVGVKDMVVVDSGDAILVMHKDASQAIKKLTEALSVTQSPLL